MKKLAAYSLIVFLVLACKKEDPSPPYDASTECDPSKIIENTNSIEGYSNKESYLPGETVHLKIHSTDSDCDIEIIRHGFVEESIDLISGVPTTVQNYNCRSYSFGCDWETTYSYDLPDPLEPGIYSAKLSNSLAEEFHVTFVVRDPNPADFLVLANTNTWQAYNAWGGQSFYTYNLNENINRSEIVSFDRPNIAATPIGDKGHLASAELHLLRWMEGNTYDFNVASDRDLHEGAVNLDDYGTLVLNVHPEYWTSSMRNKLLDFLDNGGNIINLGANCIYWKTAMSGRRIEKIVTTKRNFFLQPNERAGRWRDNGEPESELLGVEYDTRGYATWHPYTVKDPSHWVFAGTALTLEDTFGQFCINGNGASGHETDKMTIFSPENTVFLAKGTNPDWGGATMCYIEHPSGSKIFSAGSVSFTGSLSVDPVCNQIAINVFDDFK